MNLVRISCSMSAYGDVRDFFLGNGNLLVEKRVGGKLPDNLFHFRIVRKGVQRYGFRRFGEDGRLFIRGEDDLGDSCVAQPVPRVAEQGAGPQMALGQHDMGMTAKNDVDVRGIFHHFQIVIIPHVAEDDIDCVVMQAEPVHDAFVVRFIWQFPGDAVHLQDIRGLHVHQPDDAYGDGSPLDGNGGIGKEAVFQRRGGGKVGNDEFCSRHSLDVVAEGRLSVIHVVVADGRRVISQLVHQDGDGQSGFFPVVHEGIAHEIISGIHQQHMREFGTVFFHQSGEFREFIQIAVDVAGGDDDQRIFGVRFNFLCQGKWTQAEESGKENAGRDHG